MADTIIKTGTSKKKLQDSYNAGFNDSKPVGASITNDGTITVNRSNASSLYYSAANSYNAGYNAGRGAVISGLGTVGIVRNVSGRGARGSWVAPCTGTIAASSFQNEDDNAHSQPQLLVDGSVRLIKYGWFHSSYLGTTTVNKGQTITFGYEGNSSDDSHTLTWSVFYTQITGV